MLTCCATRTVLAHVPLFVLCGCRLRLGRRLTAVTTLLLRLVLLVVVLRSTVLLGRFVKKKTLNQRVQNPDLFYTKAPFAPLKKETKILFRLIYCEKKILFQLKKNQINQILTQVNGASVLLWYKIENNPSLLLSATFGFKNYPLVR